MIKAGNFCCRNKNKALFIYGITSASLISFISVILIDNFRFCDEGINSTVMWWSIKARNRSYISRLWVHKFIWDVFIDTFRKIYLPNINLSFTCQFQYLSEVLFIGQLPLVVGAALKENFHNQLCDAVWILLILYSL